MKRLLLIAPILLCAFTYGYKNNPQTGKPDMVVTGATVSDVEGFSNYTTGVNGKLGQKEPTIVPGTTSQYWRGDKSWQALGGFAALTPGTLTNTNLCTSDGTTIACTTSAALFQPAGSYPTGTGVDSGTNTGDVTIGTANGLSLSGQVLSLQAATNSVPGALTEVDHVLLLTAVQPVGAWTPYATTISAPGGTLTTATASMRYVQQGKLIYFTADFDIANRGTANGITLTIPVAANSTPAYAGTASGRDRALDSKTVTGVVSASQGKIYFAYYDGTSCAVNGAGFSVSGIYEAQ